MKKRIAVLFAVLIIAVASVFGAACNYPNKNNMYKRWGINIPAGAKEVYKSYEGGREYLLYAVYQADVLKARIRRQKDKLGTRFGWVLRREKRRLKNGFLRVRQRRKFIVRNGYHNLR